MALLSPPSVDVCMSTGGLVIVNVTAPQAHLCYSTKALLMAMRGRPPYSESGVDDVEFVGVWDSSHGQRSFVWLEIVYYKRA